MQSYSKLPLCAVVIFNTATSCNVDREIAPTKLFLEIVYTLRIKHDDGLLFPLTISSILFIFSILSFQR